MTPAAHALLAEFEAAAKSALAAEDELRKSMLERIAHLERRRAFAFRRMRLVRVLADAAASEVSETGDAWPAQRLAVRQELGWSATSETNDAILARLEPVGRAVWRRVTGAEEEAPADVVPELEAFEAWFQEKHGKPFYAVFDQYFPEVPVVDF
jgi:hypothetical protein